MTKPLPVCVCGRTLPRPLPCIWPATVWCTCGAAYSFPRREASAKVRELAREMGRATQARKRAERAEGGVTPSPAPPAPGKPARGAPGPVYPKVGDTGGDHA